MKLNALDRLVRAIDAKTSDSVIYFAAVQLGSKKETRDFVVNMQKLNQRWFYDIVSLLDMMHTDLSYADAIEMEYSACKTGYDNSDNATIFLTFKNTLPRVLEGREESETILLTKNPLPYCKLHGEWDSGDGGTGLSHDIMAGMREQKNTIQNDMRKFMGETRIHSSWYQHFYLTLYLLLNSLLALLQGSFIEGGGLESCHHSGE